ncbi:glycosyltransferase family 4 protein [Gillisia limnaea]|uniref:glycosyltransferase family 4 protein n=1 Tax=Gillisia limnaea TaxID=195907 RepID=UPI0002FBFFA4|nr:glycosyltransferase family 4 protein [Gillisia limnaea]
MKKIFLIILKLNKVQKWVVISHALKRYLIDSHDISEEKIIVAPDGADEFPHEVKPVTNLIGDFNVGYVGSLYKGKGMEIIIPLSSRMPNVDFHIVGGKEKDILHWKREINEGQKNIHFHGFIPHAKTPQYIKSFDVLIAPYQSSVHVKDEKSSNNIALWMSPLKIFEYMSSQRALITSDIPILKEILINGENAILCDPDKISEWEDAINVLMNNEILSDKISSNAYHDFLKNYTWKQRANNLINEFNNKVL